MRVWAHLGFGSAHILRVWAHLGFGSAHISRVWAHLGFGSAHILRALEHLGFGIEDLGLGRDVEVVEVGAVGLQQPRRRGRAARKRQLVPLELSR